MKVKTLKLIAAALSVFTLCGGLCFADANVKVSNIKKNDAGYNLTLSSNANVNANIYAACKDQSGVLKSVFLMDGIDLSPNILSTVIFDSDVDFTEIYIWDENLAPLTEVCEYSGSNDNGENSNENNEYSSYKTLFSNFDELNQVVYLVNCERENNGLSPLYWDLSLTKAASKRSDELLELFSHTRPDGSSCFSIFNEFDISYMTAGENIAKGQSTPEEVVEDWMNSEGHRKNILNPNFGKIGVGAVSINQGYYRGYAWVQMFTD